MCPVRNWGLRTGANQRHILAKQANSRGPIRRFFIRIYIFNNYYHLSIHQYRAPPHCASWLSERFPLDLTWEQRHTVPAREAAMPRTRFPRIRFTISALMALVATIAILTMLILPLVRLGKCPMLSTAQTARWLLSSPGQASCTNCHGTPNASPGGSAILAMKPAAETCPTLPAQTASKSCTACHTNPATKSKMPLEN